MREVQEIKLRDLFFSRTNEMKNELGFGQVLREALESDMTELTPNVRKLILGGAKPNHLEKYFSMYLEMISKLLILQLQKA